MTDEKRKLTIQERLDLLTHDELYALYNALWITEGNMTVGDFVKKYPLPVDEYGERKCI